MNRPDHNAMRPDYAISSRAQARSATRTAEVTALGDYLHRRTEHSRGPMIGARRLDPNANERAGSAPPETLRRQARHNRILGSLPLPDYERLLPSLEFVAFPYGHVIREAGCAAAHAYFPVTGIVSLTQELASGVGAEIAATGSEGVSGIALLMGGEATTGREFVRVATTGYRVRADVLRWEFDRCRPLRDALMRHAGVLVTQMAQTAACRGHHSIQEQVCRFLLSTLDRSPTNELALTHELVAHLLGVRRESVTGAARKLQTADAILCNRRRITVVDRHRLEERSCECYRAIDREAAWADAETRNQSARRVAIPNVAVGDRAQGV